MNKTGKQLLIAIFLIIILLATLSFASAGFFDWVKEKAGITGKAVDYVGYNITVGAGNAPQIYNLTGVHPISSLNEAGNFNVSINFSVNDADGIANLPLQANLTLNKTGENDRVNATCYRYEAAGNEANFTCNVDLWWFDDDGVWSVNATITDISGNEAENGTASLTLPTLTGFNLGPGNVTFATLSPGAENQTASNILVLNNTGNQDFVNGSITINATTLWGETTNTIGIYAGNFSVSNTSAAGNVQCDMSGKWASRMNASMSSWRYVEGANISRGNYTINNGLAGQEQLYLCISKIGSELSQQSYSTSRAKSWTIQAV